MGSNLCACSPGHPRPIAKRKIFLRTKPGHYLSSVKNLIFRVCSYFPLFSLLKFSKKAAARTQKYHKPVSRFRSRKPPCPPPIFLPALIMPALIKGMARKIMMSRKFPNPHQSFLLVSFFRFLPPHKILPPRKWPPPRRHLHLPPFLACIFL